MFQHRCMFVGAYLDSKPVEPCICVVNIDAHVARDCLACSGRRLVQLQPSTIGGSRQFVAHRNGYRHQMLLEVLVRSTSYPKHLRRHHDVACAQTKVPRLQTLRHIIEKLPARLRKGRQASLLVPTNLKNRSDGAQRRHVRGLVTRHALLLVPTSKAYT